MQYETDNWPFVKAKHFTDVPKNKPRSVRLIVIHTMEAPEGAQTAENVANYFRTTDTQASAHVCIDNNSVVQCVYDSDVAYAAPGCNHDGIQVELAGYAKQVSKEWMDEFGIDMLNRAADVVAQYCLKFNIPAIKLTDDQLSRGHRGIIGHSQASQVYKKSTHSDPGLNFPWEYFIAAVRVFHGIRK